MNLSGLVRASVQFDNTEVYGMQAQMIQNGINQGVQSPPNK
jgi:hypothetical protein